MLKGLYVRFAREIDPHANRRVHLLAERLVASPVRGIEQVIPGITTLYIEFDAARLPPNRLEARLRTCLESLEPTSADGRPVVDLRVRYDGEDLLEVARQTGLPPAEVIARHSAPIYTVYLIGFSPGQPYLGDVAPSLRVPRRPSPRPQVPASSLVIANSLTTIGPFAQPTGWSVLGRVLERLYDPHRPEPALLKPGDRVRFVPDPGEAPPELEPLELLPAEPRHPFLEVLEPGLLDLIVDGGRFLAEHLGFSRGGPLDARSARLANALVGNAPTAPLVEINLAGPTLEVLEPGVAAFAGWGVAPRVNGREVEAFTSFAVRRGDVLSFRPCPPGVRGYLAIAGGVDSATFMGSASVNLRGRVGRPLAPGDVLGRGDLRTARPGFGFRPPRTHPGEGVRLRITPGPQASGEALERLTSRPFTVASADRTGVRFEGQAVPGGEVISEGVPLGAIQVPPGGAPILLLNDRGPTGGYAKPALVDPRDLPLAGQLRQGTRVRFVLEHPREPRCRELEAF